MTATTPAPTPAPTPPSDALKPLAQALADAPALLRLRLSLADGQLLGDDGSQRALLPPLDAAALDALRRWHAQAPAPLHDATADGLRLRLLSAPLLASPELWIERARRPRTPLDVLVTQGWLRGDEALALNRTLQGGGNVLITSLRPSDALTLLDALLDLPDPSQGDAFFIGDTRALDTDGLPITCLDRAALKALSPDARLSLEPWLLEARWVFYDQLASNDDVRLWSGGGALGKGRVGVLTADGPQEAIHRLHALVFPQAQLPRTHVPGLVDLLVFIDRRQTGMPQALLWQVDLATGYLIALEDPDAPQDDWQPPQEEVSLDPAADLPAPPSPEEVSSNLAQAMAGAFDGLGDDLFSDDAPAAAPASSTAAAAASVAAAAVAAPSAPLPEMGLSFGDDELGGLGDSPAPAPSSGDFTFDEAELDAAAAAASAADRAKAGAAPATGNRRHPPPQAAAASSSSRYNPDAIRQDAERLRAAAPSRYRPPADAPAASGTPPPRRPSSASIPAFGSASPPPASAARTPAPRPTNPTFDRPADGSRSGSWRKPPSGVQATAAARPTVSRPPTNPSNMMRRPSSPSVEELPILPSTDLEALSDADGDGDSFSLGGQHNATAIFREGSDPNHREGTLPPDAGAYAQSNTRLFDANKPAPVLPLPLPPPPRSPEPKTGTGLQRPAPAGGDNDPNKP